MPRFSIPLCVAVVLTLSSSPLVAQGLPKPPNRQTSASQDPIQRRMIAEQAVDAALAGERPDASGKRRLDLIERVISSSEPELTIESALAVINATADSTADLVFTRMAPCRIIDTRIVGGPIAAGTTREFFVTSTYGFDAQGGASGGCRIPGDSRSVLINFVAVAPAGGGNLKVWDSSTSEPTQGSVVNYANLTPQLNIANGLAVPVCGTACGSGDIEVRAVASNTHLVADVFGYFARFQKERVREFTVHSNSTAYYAIDAGCSSQDSVTIEAPTAGRLIVEANVIAQVHHTLGTLSQVKFYLEGSCLSDTGGSSFVIPAEMPTGTYYPQTRFTGEYTVSNPGTRQIPYYSRLISGDAYFYVSQMKATFYPE